MDFYDIYPKQFRNAKIPIEKNRCFVLMPFESRFDIIYGNIKQALNENDYICNRADEIIGSKPIMNKVLNEILKSQYIIVDLTSSNPNVFYELGIAHTFKDSQNIILLKQKNEKIPFDITHLNHIMYEFNNIKYLTSNLLQTLNDNKYIYGFHEALQNCNLLSVIHDNKKEEFVDYLQLNLDSFIPQYTDILMKVNVTFKENEVDEILNKLLYFLGKTIELYRSDFFDGVIKFLFEVLLNCSQYRITDSIVYNILYGNYLTRYNLNESDIISYQTDLSILFASKGIKINIVMNWLIEYLMKSKATTIDLNRYKIERFLMVTTDAKINNIIIDSIFNKDCHIREHLADVCGEKRLFEAGETIAIQLLNEDNFFTASSLVEAIGKLDYINGAAAIMKWLEIKDKIIIETTQFFILKHIRIALSKLDKTYNTKFTNEFDKKYEIYIKDYFIL
jgi:hypothetical protein